MKTLQEALGIEDIFLLEDGSVVRWTSQGRYTYAALKTPAGWFTTARAMPEQYQHVPQVVTFSELLVILAKRETSDVRVATGDFWLSADG